MIPFLSVQLSLKVTVNRGGNSLSPRLFGDMGFFRGVLSGAIVVRRTNNKFSEATRARLKFFLLRRSDFRVKSENTPATSHLG